MRNFVFVTAAAIFGLGFGAGLTRAAETPAKDDPVDALLKRFGHPSKGLSGGDLARSLLLDEGADARIRGLVDDLSSDDFPAREKAAAELIGIEAPIDGVLWRAREAADPGLTFLLDRTLETRRNLRSLERSGYLFQVLAATPITGLAVPVARTVSALDMVRDLEVVRAGIGAVIATVDPADKAGLEAVIAEDPTKVHVAAVAGLAALAIGAGEELPSAAESWSKLGVAYALAGLGDPRTAGHLVALLEDEQVLVRGEAARLLDRSAGHQEHFVGAFDPLPRRLEKIRWWRSWISESGGNPAVAVALPGGDWRGITVVCASGKGGARVVEFGMAGFQERIYTSGVGGISGNPKSVCRTDSGRTGIMSSSGADSSNLHLFDIDGRWLWSAEGIPGGGGGAVFKGASFVLSDGQNPVLSEYDWLGTKVGEREIPGCATGLQMLPGGRLLATIPEEKAIVELDIDGVETWRMDDLEGVRFARRLANGNHFVVDGRGLTEYDVKGEAVWKLEPARDGVWGEILSAARRPGGNTYLGTDQGLLEISPRLKVVKQVLEGQINTLESY